VTRPPAEREQLSSLLLALADGAAGDGLPARPPASELLLRVARHHRLTPLLSAERGSVLPPPLAEACRHDRVTTTARNLLLAQVAEECVAALAAAGVPAILLKGLDYAMRLYPQPGARPTGDVDLMVPDRSRRDAFRVLDRLGFEPRAAAPGFDDADYHEVAWNRAGVEVDLHMALAPLARCRIDYDSVWREAEDVSLGQTEARVLSGPHAAIFHALHMAIDHFAVPAIYLIDLARLLPAARDRSAALELAGRWHCRRPLATATALAGAFLPAWPGKPDGEPSAIARRVIAGYGGTAPLPRPEQLLRKVLHFDAASDAVRYVAVQSRRNIREIAERRVHGRSARERLGLGR
jgi:hypothetical protein